MRSFLYTETDDNDLTYFILYNLKVIGRAIDVMSNVDAIADDFDIWPGVCGKDGQGAPVSDAQPTLRIPEIIVGGHI